MPKISFQKMELADYFSINSGYTNIYSTLTKVFLPRKSIFYYSGIWKKWYMVTQNDKLQNDKLQNNQFVNELNSEIIISTSHIFCTHYCIIWDAFGLRILLVGECIYTLPGPNFK